jgi:hypothetical protein
MKVFKETIDESARRISEGTLIFTLFFAFIGVLMIVTQLFTFSWEAWGTYEVDKGRIIVRGVGVSLTIWSFLTLWICYFRRVCRVLPHMCSQINWFLLLVGIFLMVPVLPHLLPHLVYMPNFYLMIYFGSLIVMSMCAHFFHRGVRSAVSKLMKQMEADRGSE